MVHDEDEVPRNILQSLVRGPEDAIVIYLAAHRQWQSRRRRCGTPDVFDQAKATTKKDALPVATPAPGISALKEPSSWLGGVVALLSFALILKLYWSLIGMINTHVNIPLFSL